MQALQNYDLLSSDTRAMDQLHAFLRQRRAAPAPVEALDAFEQELHRLFVAAEREALSYELARFDLDVPVVEVDGERCVVFCGVPRPIPVPWDRCGSRGVYIGTRRVVMPSVRWNYVLGSSRDRGPRLRRSRPPGWSRM